MGCGLGPSSPAMSILAFWMAKKKEKKLSENAY